MVKTSSDISSKVPLVVLAVPVLNAVADVTTNLFASSGFNPGSFRAIILVLLMLWFSLKKKLLTYTNLPILLFLSYTATTVANTTDVENWIMDYMKLALTFSGFLLGHWFFNTLEKLEKLNKAMMISMVVICINFVLSNVFKLGESFYAEDTLYMGGAGANITPNLAMIVLMAPLMLLTAKGSRVKAFRSATMVVAILFIILTLRRSALLALGAGVVVYGYFSPQKRRAFYLVGLGMVGLLVLTLLFQDAFEQRLAARTVDEHSLTNESRYHETFVVLDELTSKGLQHTLFGTEMFNSVTYFGGRRGLHVDYNIVLHGAGLVGIILYLLIYLGILKQFRRVTNGLKSTRLTKEMVGVFYAILVASLLISFSKGLLAIGLRMTFFMYAGALFATLREMRRQQTTSFDNQQVSLANAK